MILDELKEWLNGDRDFDRGLMLCIAHLPDKSTIELLKRQRNQGKLFTLLKEEFYRLKEDRDSKVKKPLKIEFVPETGAKAPLPEELKEQWRFVKTEQERLHTEMCMIGEGEEILSETQRKQRAELAEMILAREERLQEIGAAMNYYREHGVMPARFSLNPVSKKAKKKKAAVKLNDAEKILRLKNSLNPNISKLKKKIADAKPSIAQLSGKELAKANAKITEWEEQLRDLEIEKENLTNGKAAK